MLAPARSQAQVRFVCQPEFFIAVPRSTHLGEHHATMPSKSSKGMSEETLSEEFTRVRAPSKCGF